MINAVSLQNIYHAFNAVLPYLPEACILSDIASVKTGLHEYYKKIARNFVSTHPMFGPTFANVDRLRDENVIIITESDEEGARFFQNFFKGFGLNIFKCSFRRHDEMIAYSLTLPFASTMVFASCMNNTAVPGTTFKKHLNIARGLLSEDDYLLAEVLFNSFSYAELEKVTNKLEFLKHVIKGKDLDEAKRFFSRLRKNVL